jgi:hypothetical protein
MFGDDICTPSKLADVVTLFNYIKEGPISHFSWNTDYLNRVFYGFPQFLQPMARIVS